MIDTESVIAFAAELAVGARNSGGPYCVTVYDGPRHLSANDYYITVIVEEDTPEDGIIQFINERVNQQVWQAALRKAL